MLTLHLLMKALLCAAMAILLAVHDIRMDSPVFWVTMIGLAVAGLLGYDEGRRDAPTQQSSTSVDNSDNH